MKRLLLSVSVLVGLGATASFAAPTISRAVIPYNFTANGLEMPAGRYDLVITEDEVRLTSSSGRTAVSLPTYRLRRAERRSHVSLVMKREGQRMRLVGVRDMNADAMRIVSPGY